jgi:hypothetical protein
MPPAAGITNTLQKPSLWEGVSQGRVTCDARKEARSKCIMQSIVASYIFAVLALFRKHDFNHSGEGVIFLPSSTIMGGP